MKIKLLTTLIFAFHVSLILHIFFIINYANAKNNRDFRGFIITTFTNIGIALSIILMIMDDPQIVPSLDWDRIVFISSGFLFISVGLIKFRILLKIIGKMKDPANFHYSYFGKKVYDGSIISMREVAVYFFTVPFWLLAGAYFLVRLSSR